MEIEELLDLTVKNNASDLHIMPEMPPALRVDGELIFLANFPAISKESAEQLIFAITTPEQKEMITNNKELDFSIPYGGGIYGDLGRFRVNSYYQRGVLCAALRYLPKNIRTVEELHMPKIVHSFTTLKQGLVLVTGPTGHGKSTTLAAMVNEINQTKSSHILTVEDPIEYIYPAGKSIISQREMKSDTHSWNLALRSALREDPDVVLIGEMRDADTMAAAMTIAETGHLVLSTLHTNSASQSVDRIIDSFPEHQQAQIRTQMSFVLRGIVSQRLLPVIGGGRIPAVEVLISTPAVASNIRDGKSHLIDSVIQTSQDVGMITLEYSLAQLVLSGAVSLDMAKSYAIHVDELLRMLG